MKVAAVASSPLPAGAGGPLKAVRPGEAARCGPGPGVSPGAAEQAAAALLYDMKGCYSRLRALVPTLPRHRRVSKVELLQHVIDYIWDLQLELQCGPPAPPQLGTPPRLRAFPLPTGSSAAETALDPPRTSFPGSWSRYGHHPRDPDPEHRGSPASLTPGGPRAAWAGGAVGHILPSQIAESIPRIVYYNDAGEYCSTIAGVLLLNKS